MTFGKVVSAPLKLLISLTHLQHSGIVETSENHCCVDRNCPLNESNWWDKIWI